MSIQIEEGLHFMDNDGHTIGPMVLSGDEPREYPFYRKNGLGRWNGRGESAPDMPEIGVSKRPNLVACLPRFDDQSPDIKIAIADKAKDIVNGSRRSAYGTPEDNFERIARFWQAYFENTGRGSILVTAADVSPMMRLMKEARLCETPNHSDSFVDLVGYALTGAEINKVDPSDFS